MPTHELAGLHHPPEAVVTFVRRLLDSHPTEQMERRANARAGITLPVQVLPLDEDFQPMGEAFEAMSNDISTGGIGLVHHREIAARYLQLNLTASTGETMTLVAQVRHCTPHEKGFHIGARFVVDWSGWRQAARGGSTRDD